MPRSTCPFGGHHCGDRPASLGSCLTFHHLLTALPGSLLVIPTLLFFLHGICHTLAPLLESEYLLVHAHFFRFFVIPLLRWLDSLIFSRNFSFLSCKGPAPTPPHLGPSSSSTLSQLSEAAHLTWARFLGLSWLASLGHTQQHFQLLSVTLPAGLGCLFCCVLLLGCPSAAQPSSVVSASVTLC